MTVFLKPFFAPDEVLFDAVDAFVFWTWVKRSFTMGTSMPKPKMQLKIIGPYRVKILTQHLPGFKLEGSAPVSAQGILFDLTTAVVFEGLNSVLVTTLELAKP